LIPVQNSNVPLNQSSNDLFNQKIAPKVKNEENLYPTNNIKVSQYTTVDIDDGKSSSDFLKKLK
jgi:hypothetical protein